MTILVQLESKNWHAEGVAIMDDWLFTHPVMEKALAEIAKDHGYDFVSDRERSIAYEKIHRMVDESD